ncbi:MAG: YceI family protein [Desulfuromonadaceae bacterium]|nr:YceI family protein [Desulfuromonadaceae bacterium]
MKVTMTCNELNECSAPGVVVVDILTPEDYAAGHIPGAHNACIYEMAFLERISEYIPDRTTQVVVYDFSGTTRAAEMARERLNQAGYGNVATLGGGLSAWRAAGLPLEPGDQAVEVDMLLKDATYRIDTEKSVMEWIGRNINNRHFGRVAIQSGELVIKNSIPASGTVIMDMKSISNMDLQDTTWRDLLIRHLLSDDFFDIHHFETASFRLGGWETQEGSFPQSLTGIATGELTIKDVTRQVSFPAIVAPQTDGGIKAHAAFDIDRTLWNVCYGSGKLFERLGMHLVHDTISLELFIQAR